jgi:hypothetical protein
MPTEYSLIVRVGQPDGLLNIVLLITSDQADVTGYSLRVRVGQPECLLNIVLSITSDQADAD